MPKEIDIDRLARMNSSVYSDVPFHICTYCNRKLSPKRTTRDHIVPHSQGGRGADNFTPACSLCNQAKADLSLLDFLFHRPRNGPDAQRLVTHLAKRRKHKRKKRKGPNQQEPRLDNRQMSILHLFKSGRGGLVISQATRNELVAMSG